MVLKKMLLLTILILSISLTATAEEQQWDKVEEGKGEAFRHPLPVVAMGAIPHIIPSCGFPTMGDP